MAPERDRRDARRPLDVVMLAGGPSRALTTSSLGLPIWRLPVSAQETVIEGWQRTVEAAVAATPEVELRRSVVLISDAGEIADHPIPERPRLETERVGHRGTAGAVADVLSSWDDAEEDDLVLVIEASASPAVDLAPVFERHDPGSGVERSCIIGESRLARYCGIMLCNGRAFAEVPSVGFHDLKEQLLPDFDPGRDRLEAVVISERARRLRTRAEWIATTRAWSHLHPAATSDEASSAGTVRDSVVRPGAVVDGAVVISSIVMDDAVIEPGAVVARAIIGPGMRVGAGKRVVDATLATAGGRWFGRAQAGGARG